MITIIQSHDHWLIAHSTWARHGVRERKWRAGSGEAALNLKSFKLLLKLWNYCQHLSLITFSLSLSSLYTESSSKQFELKQNSVFFNSISKSYILPPSHSGRYLLLRTGNNSPKGMFQNLPKKLPTYYAKSCQISFNQDYDLPILSKKKLQRSHDRIGVPANSCFKLFLLKLTKVSKF